MEEICIEKKENLKIDVSKNLHFGIKPGIFSNTCLKREIVFEFQESNIKSKIFFKCVVYENVQLDLTIKLCSKNTEIENVEGYLEVRILNLSDENKLSIKPFLVIPQDQIKFEHKVSMGSVDQKSLMYLKSRGFSESQATDLIAKNFCNY